MSLQRRIEISVNGVLVGDGFTTGTGQFLTRTHLLSQCKGRYCAIHNPWPGPWSAWPTHWDSESRLMMRVCYHRIAHPAAEEYQFRNHTALRHDCCGCPCAPHPAEAAAARQFDNVIEGEVIDE